MPPARHQTDLVKNAAEPFSQENLASIFKFDTAHPDRLKTRESSWLEFKQSFSWSNKAEYARTIAAYANAKGGYIIFGVRDHPRVLVGTDIAKWEATDPTVITEFLNQAFGVEIDWEASVVQVQSVSLVVLYIREARRKPVIAAQTHGKALVEGEIYYRYRGRTQRIRYSELQALLEEQRRNEQAAWLRLFRQIAKSGIDNTALVDLNTGLGSGPGAKFVIDETLLPQLRFIREGRFVEKAGAPAIRLIGEGNLLPSALIQPVRRVLAVRNIHLPDIIEGFLQQSQVVDPPQFIRQICFEVSAFLPVYFYARLAGWLTRGEIQAFVQSVASTSPSRRKLLDRLNGPDDFALPLPGNNAHAAGRHRARLLEQLRNQELDGDLQVGDIKPALEAVRCLRLDEIDATYLLPLLLVWFREHYTHPGLPDSFRRAICYVDRCINRPEG